MLEINVVRHAETQTDDPTGLSNVGKQEARELGLKYGFNESCPKSMVSPSHPRFTSTVALITRPALESVQISDYISESIISGHLSINNGLDYRPTDISPEFQDLMNKAYKEKNNLRFLFYEAKKFNKGNVEISSAQSMHNIIAKTIQEQVVEYDNNSSDLAKNIICAREFFFPSFKLVMLDRIEGHLAADNYIEWYSEYMERNESAHLNIGKIAVIGSKLSREIIISDEFSELNFGINNALGLEVNSIFDEENLC